jgi:hypothetical protein
MQFEDFLVEATLLQINRALKAARLDLELVKGKGYWYFTGPDADMMEEQGLYAWNISITKPEEIVAEAKRRMKD